MGIGNGYRFVATICYDTSILYLIGPPFGETRCPHHVPPCRRQIFDPWPNFRLLFSVLFFFFLKTVKTSESPIWPDGVSKSCCIYGLGTRKSRHRVGTKSTMYNPFLWYRVADYVQGTNCSKPSGSHPRPRKYPAGMHSHGLTDQD